MKIIFFVAVCLTLTIKLYAQNVGIGIPTPLQKLDVSGAIRLGNTVTNSPGTIRFNNNRFEGYDGLNWNWLNGFRLPLDTTMNVASGYVLKITNSNLSPLGYSAIAGLTSSYDGVGLYGENFGGAVGSGNGVLGTSNGGGAGVKGTNIGGIGVEGTGGTVGILGSSSFGNGVESLTDFGIAIKGTALGFGGIGLDISAFNNASSTAAIFRHPRIDGRALIVEKGFVGIGEISPTALLSVKGTEATGSGLAAAISLQNGASSNKWYIRAGGLGTITPDGGLSIADNTDYRLVIGATGNIGINGFTQLGRTTEGAPVIKMKKLTTTSAALQTGSVTIAHGLTRSKILSVQVLLTYLANAADIPASYLDVAGYEYNWQVNNSDVWIINKNGNSANILSKPVRILITYEE
ncbi:MAG: hypothetical protein ACKVOW_02155 [Chitinophagaceae bacterium]